MLLVLKKIRQIEIRTKRLVTDTLAGQDHSAFKGQGLHFEEVREYTPGDEIRAIDWNVTARVGAPHVKEFREERELCLQLILDVSGSVGVGSGGIDGRTDKRLQIARLAGALAYAAIRNGDQVGLMTFRSMVVLPQPPPTTGVRGNARSWGS